MGMCILDNLNFQGQNDLQCKDIHYLKSHKILDGFSCNLGIYQLIRYMLHRSNYTLKLKK
jgi:hypothetical protein